MELSQHAKDMLREREIPEDWMWRTVRAPDRCEEGAEGNTHYIVFVYRRDAEDAGGAVIRDG